MGSYTCRKICSCLAIQSEDYLVKDSILNRVHRAGELHAELAVLRQAQLGLHGGQHLRVPPLLLGERPLEGLQAQPPDVAR